MASRIITTIQILIALLVIPLIKAQWQPNSFEASLLHQACFNTENRTACLSRISTAHRQGAGGPIPILHAAINGALEEATETIEHVSDMSAVSNDVREEMAVRDCVELLGYSLDELKWSLEMMEEIDPAVGNSHREESLRSWLSAALSNQETCMEGFDGTDGRLHVHVERKVRQLTQLVSNILALHKRLRSIIPHMVHENNTGSATFDLPPLPTWLTRDDEELMHKRRRSVHADAVVALDGTGHFRSIGEAINNSPSHSSRRYVIYVKQGEYKENVDVKRKRRNIALIGDGMGKTVISGSRSFASGWTTFRSATFAVSGPGFIARDITFRNTAGPQGRQAVALRVDSDRSVFYRCSIEGYQDTLYAHSLRQFYRDCNIYGTVDIIFGNGLIVVQHSNIYNRIPLPGQQVTITAQGRKDPNQDTGFSMQDCFVDATYPTYLGRPWKPYSRTVFMQSYLGPQVKPAGWLEWYGNFGLDTLFYGEYMNHGPGSGLGGRVKWPGYHIIKDPAMAAMFTVRRFIDGLSWLPNTGVIFTADLDG
ncbi:putative pectinesterase/pectinesterase inhibitor 22 [Carex littledalei]|uniref:Pectinesterase n=1 Tax=Carex littledalei TaxID=544730 RepID=A0A833RD96_9POAL|nr:putative pectinesterase/pectinesterase inhibitor 22 [Carex littledalei]